MSCRVDTSPLIAGTCVVSAYDGLGITGAAMRTGTGTGGSGAGLLYNDWDSGDDAKEFRGLIVTPPSSGTFTLNEDGSFSLVGAADGSYSVVYRLFLDGADMGTATASITVGAGAAFTITGVGLAGAAAFGAPTFSRFQDFALGAVGLASMGAFGQAMFVADTTFAISATGIGSGVAFGAAIFLLEGDYVPDPTNARRLVVTFDPRLQATSLPGSGGPLPQPYPFSPGSHLDIEWDWRPWIDAGDALIGYEVSWEGVGIGSLSDDAKGGGVVRTWLTVPDDAVEGSRGVLLCTVTTAEGRIDNRKYELLVKQL